MLKDIGRISGNRQASSCIFRSVSVLVLLGSLWPGAAHADRAGENIFPAWMFEKRGMFSKAAVYYDRALRGLREIYMPFHWNNDPAKFAGGKYAEEYVRYPKELEAAYKRCMSKAKITPAQLKEMQFLNEMWMDELVNFEAGGLRQCCIFTAPEAEKCGYFALGEFLRRGEARFYRVVSVPYHQKAAAACEKDGDKPSAELHRKAVKAYEQRAAFADRMSAGDGILKEIRGLGGPSPSALKLAMPPERVFPVRFQGVPGRLSKRSHTRAAKTLKTDGLKHPDEAARFAAVNALANIGEKEALVGALSDAVPQVRLAAAGALASMRWAKGWAACHRHKDPQVRAVVAPLLKPAGKVLARTSVITELIAGLDSPSADTRSFCQDALRKITGAAGNGSAQWSAWWKKQGDAKPGLKRTGPGKPPVIDETVDFGTWWHYWFRPGNPLRKYKEPATIRWDGHVAVTRPGDYRFYVRNCGESRTEKNAVPGLGQIFLPSPCIKLTVDNKVLIPNPPNAVEDSNGMRLDIGKSIHLDEGLHRIRLEFEWRGPALPPNRSGRYGGNPEVRLYWSSEHFLRQLIPTEHLVTLQQGGQP